MNIAIIGGTGLYDPGLLEQPRMERIGTPFGEAGVIIGRYEGEEIAFLPRHGPGHTIPPHLVNYRANIWALRSLGVRRILATATVGSLDEKIGPGHLVVIDQFLDFTRGRAQTFFEGGEAKVVHVDLTEPYCPELRRVLVEAALAEGMQVEDGGVYVCTEGPRYETPAEIKAFRLLGGDVVGMTGVPEVTLAKELNMCYATLALVTNHAAGISPSPLSHEEVVRVMTANLAQLRVILLKAIRSIPLQPACLCQYANPHAGELFLT